MHPFSLSKEQHTSVTGGNLAPSIIFRDVGGIDTPSDLVQEGGETVITMGFNLGEGADDIAPPIEGPIKPELF